MDRFFTPKSKNARYAQRPTEVRAGAYGADLAASLNQKEKLTRNGWAWTGLGLGFIVTVGAGLVAQVPGGGEIARLKPQGHKLYFLGALTSLTYEFSL
jgi:hypothetical protein